MDNIDDTTAAETMEAAAPRLLSRQVAVVLNYAAFFSDPEAARAGDVPLREIGRASTCTGGDDEDAG